MCEAAKFSPDPDYKTVEGLMKNVINTSMIKTGKGAGFPYAAEGLPTNGDVLKQYGEKGFAQHVLNMWKSVFEIRWFLKWEPTKKSKLEKGMPRGIANLPLHVTVKHASIFKNLAFALVRTWKETPIKYAYTPAKPGHIEHLKEVLPGKVVESDKSNWDFNFLPWIAQATCGVVQNLAIRPQGWTEEQLNDYKDDVKEAFDQVFNKSVYRTSNGTVVRMNIDGIMKSGWFMTISANSIAQVVVHVMACMMLGMSDEEILALPIVAGGDDVNQNLDGVDLKAYTEALEKIGVPTEVETRESLESSEYFSRDIRRGPDGLFQFFPKRFTKHVENLKTVKRADLAGALRSHMEEYRHSPRHFDFWMQIYHELREKYPDEFQIKYLRERQELLAEQYGLEALFQFGDDSFC